MTSINMLRLDLTTKEGMEKYYKGEEGMKDSVNDDLESFFDDLRFGKEPVEYVETYFLPKLTEEEIKLAEQRVFRDKLFTNYCYLDSPDSDAREAQIKHSESDSKFVRGFCYRRTFTFENLSLQNTSNCCNLQ